jgi:hypothetical protein
MRTLTDAEGRVIAVLLGSTPSNERDRLARMQVPRSTYHAARKRAYEENWLRDRYVPDPARFGAPLATVAVVRPFADRIPELSKRLEADRTNVVAWVGAQSALCVFFHSDRKAAAKALAGLSSSGLASSVTSVVSQIDRSELPVYFDYEGLWSHLSGLSGAATYPNGLGGRSLGPDDEAPTASPHQLWGARELVLRPFDAEARGRGGHLVGPFGLPFSQQKLLRTGWVTYRVFLEPSLLPPFRGRSADQVALISGRLRAGARPEGLFVALTRDCHVFPFLYATDGERVILGGLGRAPGPPTPGPAPVPEPERQPVMATLQATLEGIEVHQEAAAQLRAVVDHRYDRLFPTAGPR